MPTEKYFDLYDDGPLEVLTLVEPQLFDHLIISEIGDALLEYVKSAQPEKLIVDFRRVEFCSSSFVNAMLRAKKQMITYDGTLVLCGMQPHVYETFKLLNLVGTVFQIYDSLEEAKAAFA